MKKLALALSAAGIVGFSGIAGAADLPARPVMTAAPAFSWTGVYVGLNAGYGFGRLSDTTGISGNMNGGLAGGQIGANWQTGMFVLGVEGDFQGTWQKRTVTAGAITAQWTLPWFATARARAGIAVDRSLFYVTGGAAWGNLKLNVTAPGGSVSSDDTKIAGTVGGGWEYAFSQNWSSKIEYLYVDTGNTSVTLFGTTVSGRLQDHIVRAGVNYRF